jgi:NNP family nitrate/nitrite transporter-like MFS transporter
VLAALGAALYMDNLTRPATRSGHARRGREGHTWIMALLYIGTFGSFIGFGFAFGQVLQVQFATDFNTPVKAAYLTFLGPLLGSLIRPVGGALADRLGGAPGHLLELRGDGRRARASCSSPPSCARCRCTWSAHRPVHLQRHRQRLDVQMIPRIFSLKNPGDDHEGPPPVRRGDRHRGAIGAFGGVLVNLAFRQSFLTYKSADAAYIGFIAFYALCFAVTWFVYLRPSSNRLEGV